MNLYYNGVDIYGDVSVNYCVHEMFAEKQADTLVIRFNDTKGTWSKWQPAEGDTVQFKEGASDTGKMFVHSMKPENGLFTIRAMSMPKSGKTKKSKSWEGVRFLQLANEFAGNHGLTFQNYGCADQVYPYIKQDNETDFALFHRLCALEGCQMLIFDGKLLAYNEQYIEGQTPAGSLSVDENGVFSYEDNRGGMYGSSFKMCMTRPPPIPAAIIVSASSIFKFTRPSERRVTIFPSSPCSRICVSALSNGPLLISMAIADGTSPFCVR